MCHNWWHWYSWCSYYYKPHTLPKINRCLWDTYCNTCYCIESKGKCSLCSFLNCPDRRYRLSCKANS